MESACIPASSSGCQPWAPTRLSRSAKNSALSDEYNPLDFAALALGMGEASEAEPPGRLSVEIRSREI